MSLDNRIPPPLVFLGTALLMYLGSPPADPLPGSLVLIPLLLLLALVNAVPAFFRFRVAGTTISPLQPESASSLVTAGPYGWTRNPMYLGLTSLLLAWAIYLGSAQGFAGPILFAIYITRFQILPEERALRAAFGQAYLDYCRQVPRWI
ncbi:isoprenylcysteine carboxylmethyltransferase family protein [bacterium]|nr:isoprenylcysteine carboxylmethyltransferase family protein [bacterium]